MASRVVFGRHVSYYPQDLSPGDVAPDTVGYCESSGTGTIPAQPPDNGTPIVRVLDFVQCTGGIPTYPGARHIDTTPTALPKLAVPWTCCDAISDNYVETTCWPTGSGPGITDVLYAYLTNVDNCVSAEGKRVRLEYNITDAKWYGSVGLRGGTLYLAVSCNSALLVTDPAKFILEYWGCEPSCDDPTAAGTSSTSCQATAGYSCLEPLSIDFGQITLPNCCDCLNTTSSAEVGIVVRGNCRKTVMGRHIDYVQVTGTASLAGGTPDRIIPVIAYQRNCDWDRENERGCGDVKCGLVAVITGDINCACLDGTYTFPYTATIGSPDLWEVSIGSLGCTGLLTMACTDNCNGTVTYYLSITCGATNTGSATITIPDDEVEDLDITVTINLIDPCAGDCAGVGCTYQWNAMAATWSLIGDECSWPCGVTGPTGDCPCPNGPIDNSPGTIDGELRVDPCSGAANPAECCVGSVTVRITR